MAMSNIAGQKRKRQTASSGTTHRSRKAKRAAAYHSSSEDEEAGVEVDAANDFDADNVSEQSGDDTIELPNLTTSTSPANDHVSASSDDASDADSDGEDDIASSDASEDGARGGPRPKRNRNDPTRLATSISSILGAKLTSTQRADPILSRSVAASNTSKEVSESRLEAKARRKLRDEKRTAKERGRVKDVLGLEDTKVSTAEIAEQEKRLRKMAQRGVVKLFNAVRAAQVKGEQAAREASGLVAGGTETALVGTDRRKERVNEMSKKGFLDLLAGGGA